MNWLAKINLGIVITRLGPFKSAVFLVLVISLSLFVGYRVGNFYHTFQKNTLEQQTQRLEKFYAKQLSQTQRINTLEVELEVERLANQESQAMLKSMEEEHYQVKKQLAFYEKIMAPEKQADGLVIDDIKILPTESPNHYRFQVILVQQQLKKRYAKGYVELVFAGSLNNKPHQLKLSEVSSLTKKMLSFSFQYFQIVEGEFTLPENFSPESVMLAAILPKGRWQKYQRIDQTTPWQLNNPL